MTSDNKTPDFILYDEIEEAIKKHFMRGAPITDEAINALSRWYNASKRPS